MIAFPDDTEQSIRAVLGYAKSLNATYANFNILTPYPGTKLFREHCRASGEPRFEDFTVYKAVLPGRNLSTEQIQALHDKCFRQYYFRWQYLLDNADLLWPGLRRLGVGTRRPKPAPMRRAAQRLGVRRFIAAFPDARATTAARRSSRETWRVMIFGH